MAAETGDGAGQWTETEVAELISIWGDNSIQAKLEGSYRNRAVFECIAKEMIGRGHRRTWLQCQRKVKSLRAKFKEAKDINKRSGRGRVTCPFYDELDRILGDKPSCQPIELIDSSIETAEEEPESPGLPSLCHCVYLRILENPGIVDASWPSSVDVSETVGKTTFGKREHFISTVNLQILTDVCNYPLKH
uniref:Myb/SANT-like DNA-binding domain-containing protein n=1 Tax=Maylandia zebra TaxID=106582 RepID=A0A3P9CCL3_9CICH